MRRTNDVMSILATLLLFVLLGLAGLAVAGLLTGILLFLAIFAVGLAVVGAVGFAVAALLRLVAGRRWPRSRLAGSYHLEIRRERRGVPQRP